MHLATASTVLSMLAMAAATPANNLFARHDECTYSAVQGPAQHQAGTEARYCEIQGSMEGVYGCDFAWRNNAKMSPCGEAKRSKYACQKDGDPCWAFQYKENSALSIIHCSNK
ncbi:hypothetical protein PG994_005253 [Apiospora phragmitis]|uniref:Uncharacterized protein n=1 Tax=Apiospora phragmitis TaxID=2905665 RepID=A0ABR1VSX6_9PEZI